MVFFCSSNTIPREQALSNLSNTSPSPKPSSSGSSPPNFPRCVPIFHPISLSLHTSLLISPHLFPSFSTPTARRPAIPQIPHPHRSIHHRLQHPHPPLLNRPLPNLHQPSMWLRLPRRGQPHLIIRRPQKTRTRVADRQVYLAGRLMTTRIDYPPSPIKKN